MSYYEEKKSVCETYREGEGKRVWDRTVGNGLVSPYLSSSLLYYESI